MSGQPPDQPVDEIDAARAGEYALLATLLHRAPDADLLERFALLPGDETPLGVAHATLAAAARTTSPARVGQEFFDLFIGLGRGELLPYGSYYLSGFLHERPLARLRQDLAMLGIERAPDRKESEDHAAMLCEVMAGIISRALPRPSDAGQSFFLAHVGSWAGRFFADLERAETAHFYRSVGTLGRTFIEIEAAGFALAP